MNDTMIVAAYSVIDDVMKASNHHERVLYIMKQLGYPSDTISISRFNRRLHKVTHCFMAVLAVVGDIFDQGEVFIINSMPVPVCKRARARRNKKVRGQAFV